MKRIEQRNLLAGLAVAGAMVASVVLFVVGTRWGLGLDGDSALYLDLARSLRAGHGYVVTDFGRLTADEAVTVTQFPPGYAWLISLSESPRAWAWWLHSLVRPLTIGLIALASWRWSGSVVSGVVAAWWAALSPDLLRLNAMLLSETPFLLACIGTLVALAETRHRGWRMVVCAGLFLALAMLLRYAGILLLGVGLVSMALGKPLAATEQADDQRNAYSLRSRLQGTVTWTILFSLIAVLPLLIWRLAANAIASREIGWHPPGLNDLVVAWRTIGRWLIPILPDRPAGWLGLLVLTLLLALSLLVWRRPRLRPAWLLALVALPFLVVVHTLMDANVGFGGRMLAPMLVAFIPLACALAARRQRTLWLFVPVVLLNGWQSLDYARQWHSDGIGYASPTWANSRTLDYLSTLPPDLPITSDAADVIGVLLNRPAEILPMTRFPHVDRVNRGWRDELRELGGRYTERDGIVVFFRHVDRSDFRVSEAQLIERLDVQRVASFEDGVVYRIRGVH